MNLEITYKDSSGTSNDLTIKMSYLAFIKHLAIAGQGYMPSISKFKRCMGMFLHYSDYIKKVDFDKDFFSLPSGYKYDPTEKNQFSNLAGKAIADFLSKQISGGNITFNYEAAMKIAGYKIKGSRPDLLCVGKEKFAIEAKGFTRKTVSEDDMKDHKDQSSMGPLKVDFSVASVAYNLYDKIHVNYYDPSNDNNVNDYDIISNLTKKYYSGLEEYINRDLFRIDEVMIDGSKYYMIWFEWIIRSHESLALLINKEIVEKAKNGVINFDFTPYNDEVVYIDRDGVGIAVDYFKIFTDKDPLIF